MIKSNLRNIIIERVTRMNEDNTEEALIYMIADNIVKCSNISEVYVDVKSVVNESNKKKSIKSDLENKEIFLYCNNSLYDWTYERCVNIVEAVKKAVKRIDAYIICNGNIISYNTLNDNMAYYCVDDKIKIVNL